MKTKSFLLLCLATLIAAPAAFAADTVTVPTWHAQSIYHACAREDQHVGDGLVDGLRVQSIYQAVANMLVFAGAGMVAAIAGFKLFDFCTPGSLAKEILENKNIAAAIVSASVILGVCIIIAAAMFS